MKKPLTLLIAHRDPSFYQQAGQTFREQKDIKLFYTTESDQGLLRIVGKQQPRILLLETGLIKGRNLQLVSRLRQISPNTKVIMLSKKYALDQELDAAIIGARGFIGGPVKPEILRKAVRATDAGEVWMRRKTVSLVLNEYLRPPAQRYS